MHILSARCKVSNAMMAARCDSGWLVFVLRRQSLGGSQACLAGRVSRKRVLTAAHATCRYQRALETLATVSHRYRDHEDLLLAMPRPMLATVSGGETRTKCDTARFRDFAYFPIGVLDRDTLGAVLLW